MIVFVEGPGKRGRWKANSRIVGGRNCATHVAATQQPNPPAMFLQALADASGDSLLPFSPPPVTPPESVFALSSPPALDKPEGPRKKRKATYLVRKEEQSALQREVERLESQVAVLRSRSLPPEEAARADPALQRREAENAALSSVLRHQQLHVANAQSLLSRCLGVQHTHPLYTRIRLSRDWPERRATLRAIRAEKLRNAYEYILARSSHAQPEKMQLSDDRFESPGGDLCCVRFETVHFRGVESLEQVYNALIFYLTNMEISISERLGHITVRDDYDSIEGTAYNSRIASTEDSGVTTEMNAVSFPHLFARDELGAGVGPCAVMASDCVDEDELYPYNATERVRKDVSAAVVLTVGRRKTKQRGFRQIGTAKATGEEETELVVTMRRAAFVKLHKPQFPVSPFAMQELHEGIARWGDVMLKTIRSVVASRAYAEANRAGVTRKKPAIPSGRNSVTLSKVQGLVLSMQSNMVKCPKTLTIQSNVHGLQREQDWNPLSTAICLGKDWRDRRAALQLLRPQKLQAAYEYITGVFPLEGPTAPQDSNERFETPEGDICCSRLEIVHFTGVKSIQQVFNALKIYVDNMEIIVSERLGHVALREDYDIIENFAYNARIVSQNNNGIRIENNVVGFASINDINREPGAVVAIDSVNKDALHPYATRERVRREVSIAIVLTATNVDRVSVVTMRRAAFLKLHHPEFSVPSSALQGLQVDVAQWGNLMTQTMRDVLNAAS
ncbi:unnamed protein product [Phytophthora fragariaefolia]|uniref:Unnamed protein product n=1 Tax=Phytophthora fragariaefolia TaxID=1490495 RepID=A0A9W6U4G9_9STRA|nr:unnamed protein product [Phytophthora fragariaefolia]